MATDTNITDTGECYFHKYRGTALHPLQYCNEEQNMQAEPTVRLNRKEELFLLLVSHPLAGRLVAANSVVKEERMHKQETSTLSA